MSLKRFKQNSTASYIIFCFIITFLISLLVYMHKQETYLEEYKEKVQDLEMDLARTCNNLPEKSNGTCLFFLNDKREMCASAKHINSKLCLLIYPYEKGER